MLALTVTLAACGSGEDALIPHDPVVEVTQTAPDIWAAPTDEAGESDTHDDVATLAAASSDLSGEHLPGLSAECSSTIKAQLAINTLFSDAIAAMPEIGEGDGAAEEESDEPVPGSLTRIQIRALFSQLDTPQLAPLRTELATIEEAALEVVGQDAIAVAHMLSESDVRTAFATISKTIADCQPEVTSE